MSDRSRAGSARDRDPQRDLRRVQANIDNLKVAVDAADAVLTAAVAAADAAADAAMAAAQSAWPIGSVFISLVATNPNTLIGYGTWARVAQGRFLVSQDVTDVDFDVARDAGGAKTHTHADHASHTHTTNVTVDAHATHSHTGSSNVSVAEHSPLMGAASGGDLEVVVAPGDHSVTNGSLTINNGGPTTHTVNNPASAGPSAALSHTAASGLPPFFTVYMWERVS